MDLHTWIAQQVDATETEGRAMLIDPTPILRRCEAEREVLARHTMQPWLGTICVGCGWEGDCGAPITENLNDCPELLHLARAHAITPKIHNNLDRPQAPEPPRATRITTTSDVPAALRGPRWTP